MDGGGREKYCIEENLVWSIEVKRVRPLRRRNTIYSIECDGVMQRKGTSVCKCIVVDEYIVRWSDTVGMKGAQCDGGGITD